MDEKSEGAGRDERDREGRWWTVNVVQQNAVIVTVVSAREKEYEEPEDDSEKLP